MHIRQAQLDDRDGVTRLYLSAFSESEREAVAEVAHNLLAETTTHPTVSLVAETNGNIVGHVGFSPMAHEDSGNFMGYILAPVAVHPEFQKRGIGTVLIESGFECIVSFGAAIVFVYGDPKYYGRFGFDARIGAKFTPPYDLQYEDGWQAKPLTEIKPDNFPSSGRLTCVRSLMDPQLW